MLDLLKKSKFTLIHFHLCDNEVAHGNLQKSSQPWLHSPVGRVFSGCARMVRAYVNYLRNTRRLPIMDWIREMVRLWSSVKWGSTQRIYSENNYIVLVTAIDLVVWINTRRFARILKKVNVRTCISVKFERKHTLSYAYVRATFQWFECAYVC